MYGSITGNRTMFYRSPDESGGADTGTPPVNNGGDSAAGGVTFTAEQQKQIDALLGERARRAKDAAIADLLSGLGVEKVDDAKALIEQQRKADEASKTETERLTSQLEKLVKERDELKAALEQERTGRVNDKRDAAIRVAAQAAGAINADDAILFAMLSENADALTNTVKDGAVNEAAVKALVEAYQKARPHHFAAARMRSPGSPPNGGTTGGAVKPNQQQRDAARDAQAARTRRGWS